MGDLTIQNTIPLLGTAAVPITLTGSYTNSSAAILNTAKMSRVVFHVYYTMGAAETANSIEVKLEAANTNLLLTSTLWTRLTTTQISSGTVTHSYREDTFTAVAAAATYDMFPIELVDLNADYMKVSVKETGISSNGGSCYIIAEVFGR